MSPEVERVRNLFVAAVKLPPEQWESFLNEACHDGELRRQAIDLLREHQQAGNFLDRPAARVPDTGEIDLVANGAGAAAALEVPGATIGHYKLLELIGEGGMGEVWMAEQREPIQRQVALKIIKEGMDTRQVVARFEAERQALALMDHPNIAKVLDGGATSGGRPYFVMELVKGVPITRYCDEHRLTPRERLELFLPVCQAIQHAHTKGLIHRDIKPANVLVAPYDGIPVPKVIDFGVAKATGQRLTERTLFTGFGTVVGTLEYMSPEQAELNNQDIDTRSDIYSLGVLLFELLTGTTPLSHERLKQSAFTEMLRAIREEEPPRPSTRLSESKDTLPAISAQRQMEPAKLTRLVKGELDWIVMKALEKDRNRRYETANNFAMDVQRYLADEPVQACPPSVGYRLRKLVRRNKGPVIAVSLVLLALVAGIIGTSWGLFRAEQARQDAVAAQIAEADRAKGERRAKDEAQKAFEAERKARKAESNQRLRAEDNAKLAMAVLDEIMKEAQQRLTSSMQDEAKGVAKDPQREKLDRESLEKGLRFYEQLAQTNATDWVARRERAMAYWSVGLLRLHLKDYEDCENAFRQAVRLMEELAGERPDDFDNAYDLANTYHWFYRAYWDTGRFEAAAEVTRRSLGLFEKLAADFPERRLQAQQGQATCHQNLGVLLRKAGKPHEVEKALRQSLTICAELSAANPELVDRWVVSWSYRLLADSLLEQGKHSQAEEAYRQGITLAERLVRESPAVAGYRDQLVELGTGLANLLRRMGRTQEVESNYRQAIEFYRKVAAANPDVPELRHALARNHDDLAQLLQENGHVNEAEEAYRQALAIYEKLVIAFPSNAEYRSRMSGNLGALAENLLQQGKHAEAAQVAEKMADPRPKDANGYERVVLVWIRCIALAEKDTALLETDRGTVTKSYADQSLELIREATNGGMATPLLRTLGEALPLRPDDPQGRYKLGNALLKHEMVVQAEEEFRAALRLRADFAEAHAKLGEALRRQGKNAEAVAECQEALRLLPGDPGACLTLGLALGWGKKKPATVARFYADALAAHPKLADDLRFQNRYNAACAAALAGCGQGEDGATLDDAERARLRRQALDWLRADLAAWRQLLEKDPDQTRPRVQRTLRHWQQDADFAGVRGDALAKLPEAERPAWHQLWADVEQTLKNADAKDTKGAGKKSPE